MPQDACSTIASHLQTWGDRDIIIRKNPQTNSVLSKTSARIFASYLYNYVSWRKIIGNRFERSLTKFRLVVRFFTFKEVMPSVSPCLVWSLPLQTPSASHPDVGEPSGVLACPLSFSWFCMRGAWTKKKKKKISIQQESAH